MSFRRIAGASWPAVALWGAAAACVLATCAASGYRPVDPTTWARWDSGLYLEVAEHGYSLHRCAAPDETHWCGNAGWFGAYPLLIAAGHALGMPFGAAALALSWLFCLGTIVLLWLTFFRRRASMAGAGALAYAAFAPGQVYDYAVFPLSMLAFFTVAHLWLLTRGRWVIAGLAGAVAAATYPLGTLVIPAAAIWLLAVQRRLRPIAVVCGLALLGPALLVLVQAVQVGHADAYLLVQEKYGHGLRDPLGPVINAAYAVVRRSPFDLASAPDVQTLFVALVLACVLVELAVRRASATRADVLVGLWAALTWTVPNLETNLSIYRSQAALLPLSLLVRRLPRPMIAVAIAVAVWLSISMTQLFLHGRLI
jgi:hypothetical protein